MKPEINEELKQLLESAKSHVMTAEERAEQRISFAYGNGSMSNERITKDSVREAARMMLFGTIYAIAFALLCFPAHAQITMSGGTNRSIVVSGRQAEAVTAHEANRLRPVVTELPSTQACPPEVAAIALSLLRLEPHDLLADIGCGDGRQLIRAVQQYGCSGLGIEIVPALANSARAAVDAAGLSDRIEIITADARRVDLSDVTAVFLYHFNEELEWIEPMVSGKRVASAFHPLPTRTGGQQIGDVWYYAGYEQQAEQSVTASPQQSAAYLVLFSTANCAPCNSWKSIDLPKLRSAGIYPTLVDINQQPQWGVTAGPEFWIVDRKTKRTLRRLRGYQSAVYLQTLIQSYDIGDVHSPEVTQRIQNGPQQRYRIFDGVPGSSFQNRQSLIQHLLGTGIHPGKQHTLDELNRMTDQELDDLHTQDHREEGQVRVISGSQPTVQRNVRTAVWGNRTYSAPVCSRPGCSMCNSIRRQLGW